VHELSVVSEIIRIVSEEADLHGKGRVESIHLVIGELTGHSTEGLQFSFDILAEGTSLEGARLDVQYVKPVLQCPSCGLVFDKDGPSLRCPACGATACMDGSGRELYIDAVEIVENSHCAGIAQGR
jgi:hydrogenase nickel incorporation protein HypA/HybF